MPSQELSIDLGDLSLQLQVFLGLACEQFACQNRQDPKREVIIYDYVDRDVPVLARMAAKRAAGYSAIGYTIAQGPGLFDGQHTASSKNMHLTPYSF
jgi:hypothetical protein